MITEVTTVNAKLATSPVAIEPPEKVITQISQLSIEDQIEFFTYLDEVIAGFPKREDRLRELSKLFSPQVQRMAVLFLDRKTVVPASEGNQRPPNTNAITTKSNNFSSLVISGGELKGIRTSRGLSAREVVDRLKKAAKELRYTGNLPKSENWLYAIETGKAKLNLKYISLLAQALAVNEEEFINKDTK